MKFRKNYQHLLFSPNYHTGGTLTSIQDTNYSTGGFLIITQNNYFSTGGILLNIQDADCSTGGILKCSSGEIISVWSGI